jgi:uncharacterized protein YbjT (DUF2867 family)
VLLLGGTAQVGLHVLAKLLEAEVNTIALSRSPQSPQHRTHTSGAAVWWLPEGYLRNEGDFHDSNTLENLPAPDWLISAGPIRIAIESLQRFGQLQQVVCLSTSSVMTKTDSGDPIEREQIQQILQAEKQLEAICSARKIGLVILRPTLIYGCGMDENISGMARFIERFGFLPLAGDARGLRQPIHVADLAELMVLIATTGVADRNVYTVVGGSTLTYRDMAAGVFRALGKKERLISVPPGLLASGVSIARKLFGMKHLNAQMVLRQNLDLVFDDQPVRQRYNFQSRAFQPRSADFSLPAELRSYLPD